MNCEHFQALLQDLACDEGLDVATLKDAMEHADACRACDDLLEEAEALTTSLRSLGASYASVGAPPHIEKALLQSLAVRRNMTVRSWSKRLLAGGSIAGVAAVALLAISLAPHQPVASPDLRTVQAMPASPGQVVTSNPTRLAVPAAARSLQALAPQFAGEQADGRAAAEAAGQEDWLSSFGDDERSASSFVPLSETFDPASVEDDSVVRVVLSREALDSFGVHLGEAKTIDGANNQVVADLIVTNDGTPQAIRVVGW